MNKSYHMITGLPRSGSTLLSSILNQNPKFYSSITDSLANLVRGVVDVSQEGPGMKNIVPVEKRKVLVRKLFEGFYYDIDSKVIFNTNRGWSYLSNMIKDLYPNSKFLVTVRDIQWILDSFELAHRRNPFTTNTFAGNNSGSVYSRADDLMKNDGIVGFAYTGLKQLLYGAEKDMIMIIEYEQLCRNPEGMMRAIYQFIQEDYYDHDFESIDSNWDEYDAEIGSDLHKVKSKIQFNERNTILPPDLIKKYSGMECWR